MGNNSSYNTESEDGPSQKSRILFYLYKTWTVIVSDKWTRSRTSQTINDTISEYESNYSQYSFCSCSQCQRDDGFSSACDSELFGSGSSMAPNSEESIRIEPSGFSFNDDSVTKEKQRPPIYNPEDYVVSLKKWGKRTPNGTPPICLYTTNQTLSDLECPKVKTSFRDYRNPMLTSISGSEMSLKQFCTVSELLAKLKSDLRLAYSSFIQEFVSEPLDGITLLLDLLRAIQLSQSNNGHSTTSSTTKMPLSLQRKALLDELSCLQCILTCCERYSDSVRKLISSSAGLFTLAICVMSTVTKSRISALQLLTKVLKSPYNGHNVVTEAMSTLRLRFGEPVRFRFLVGMLLSTGGQGDLLMEGMRFLNVFLDTAETPQKRIYIQAELEQAGFDINVIKKNISTNAVTAEGIFEEIHHWDKHHLDVEMLMTRLDNVEKENDSLRDKVLFLERRIQILQEEKGVLVNLEQCLKDRCSELQTEVHSLKSEKSPRNTYLKKGDCPQEDEGISSSERSPTPEGTDLQRESSIYEIYSVQSETIPIETNKEEDDEETTIEEVMEELNNIINEAETDVYNKEKTNKIKVEYSESEAEIIPSNLHPHPPKRARSLIHLFIPAEDYSCTNKEFFFENETIMYTSEEEGSDSLLSASKYQMPRLEAKTDRKSNRYNTKVNIKRSESFRHTKKVENQPKQNSFDGSYYYNTPTIINQVEKPPKSKSLDRIDDGLDSMVDIVVMTEKSERKLSGFKEKQRVFLPNNEETRFYFPRIQERNMSASFLIKRGHTNAGLYSGQVFRDCPGTVVALKSRELVQAASSNKSSNGKFTDSPSGLY